MNTNCEFTIFFLSNSDTKSVGTSPSVQRLESRCILGSVTDRYFRGNTTRKSKMATGRTPKPPPPSNPFVQFFGHVKGAFSDKPKIIVDKRTMEKAWKLMDKVREGWELDDKTSCFSLFWALTVR